MDIAFDHRSNGAMKPTRTASAATCALLMITSCSSASDHNRTTNTSTDATTVTTEAVASTDREEAADLGSGIVAGDPFVGTGQFVQFDPISSAWRLHIVDGAHTCEDDLAAIRPAVGIDFLVPSEVPVTAVSSGTTTDVGVVFVPAEGPADRAPLTTTIGVTLTIDSADAEPPGRWAGHLTVASAEQDGVEYAFDGPIDAQVCPVASA